MPKTCHQEGRQSGLAERRILPPRRESQSFTTLTAGRMTNQLLAVSNARDLRRVRPVHPVFPCRSFQGSPPAAANASPCGTTAVRAESDGFEVRCQRPPLNRHPHACVDPYDRRRTGTVSRFPAIGYSGNVRRPWHPRQPAPFLDPAGGPSGSTGDFRR
jgi:hypothetical protein